MSLLLQSDIDSLVKSNIRGHIGRAGGSVNQLLDYNDCTVEDINIPDGGFGEVVSGRQAQSLLKKLYIYRKYISQEIKFLRKGSKVSRDRKTVILDLHQAWQNDFVKHRYDCSISSNMIEHSPNPIFLLLNFFHITKKDGFQYHAIPHYKYTYDKFREPTTLDHLIDDFMKMTKEDDYTHNQDYAQSAIEKHGWQREFHKKYPIAYPYIHFHVFDEHNTKDLMEYVFEDVTHDIIKTDSFSDNVVLFKNSLNKNFIKTHGRFLRKHNFITGQ